MKQVCPVILLICLLVFSALAFSQVSGQSVNMVSGTDWTTGDPFLERQNEPSITVSTRNNLHLLAGDNDYRTVDLPGLLGIEETGDAWLGVFKSFDGGLTWSSTLLPGYPLDSSAQGQASPIHGYQAGADPTVRSGPGGMLYYSGIAFNRTPANNAAAAVFLARFVDNNNRENGDPTAKNSLTNVAPSDPIRYLGTYVVATGTAGQLLDKPWIAVDVPRNTNTCTINFTNPDGTQGTEQVPAARVFLAYANFTGTGGSTKINITYSDNCGASFPTPTKISQTNSTNQGTIIAIDPSVPTTSPATVYVAWRRFANGSNPDAIVMAKSTDGGNTWSKAVDVIDYPISCASNPPSSSTASGCPFDADNSSTTQMFRTNSYPALAVDNTGRIYIAAAQRDSHGDAKIVMTISADGGNTWTNATPIDIGPVNGDNGTQFTNLSGRGHQIMPTMSFNAGKLSLAYYDLRQDHTVGVFSPTTDANGNPVYSEARQLLEELGGTCSGFGFNNVFNSWIDDMTLGCRRHTIDVMGAQASPQSAGVVSPPSFNTFRVSRYLMGYDNVDPLQPSQQVAQLQVDPADLPMFVKGTTAFMGDYIDIGGDPPFVLQNGAWQFNTSNSNPQVFHVTWTDNRDVAEPPDGNWANYVPPYSISNPTTVHNSWFDPTQQVTQCVAGVNDQYVGTRNQNIYTARIDPQLLVSSPGNQKPLGFIPNSSPQQLLERAFTIYARNNTGQSRNIRLVVVNQPALANGSPDPGGRAAFNAKGTTPDPTTTPSCEQLANVFSLDVTIPQYSNIARSVFIMSQNPAASVTVNAVEITAVCGSPVSGSSLNGSITFNPDPNAPQIINPAGLPAGSPNILAAETYTPSITPAIISSPLNSNGSILSPQVQNYTLKSNGAPQNYSLKSNYTLKSNSSVNYSLKSNTNLNAPLNDSSAYNSTIANQVVNGAQVTDAIYTVNNNGNTSASYVVKLFDSDSTLSNLPYPLCSPSTPPGTQCIDLQLMLAKQYLTPTQDPQNTCNLAILNNFVTGVNVVPSIVTNTGILGNPVAFDSNTSNATITLAPGETGFIILRSNLSVQDLQTLISATTPVVVAHAANTGTANPPATLTILSGTLPAGFATQSYNTSVNTFGGVAPYSFTFLDGNGNPTLTDPSTGLTINGSTGAIRGTLPATGSYNLTVQVTDSATVPSTISRVLSLKVVAPLVITTTSLPNGLVGQPYSQVLQTSGGTGAHYTWSATGLPSFLSLDPNSGTLSVPNPQSATPGSYNFTVSVSDPGPPAQTANQYLSVTFTENTSVSVIASPTPVLFGNAVTASVIVSSSVSGTPTGTVSVSDSTGASCNLTLSGGSGTCQLTPKSVGADTLTATYSGDSNYNSNSGTTTLQVNQTGTATTLTPASASAVVGQPITMNFTVSAVGSSGTPAGAVTVDDGTGDTCSGPLTSGAGSCSLNPTTPGNKTLTAKYSGNANYAGSSGTASLQVTQAASSTTVNSSQTNVVSGQTITANFSVSANAPSSGNPVPTGTVTVTNATGGSCTGTLSSGSGTCALVVGGSGSSSLTGVYSGDSNYTGSTSPASGSITIGKANTTTSASSSPNPSSVGQGVTVNVNVAPAFSGTPTGTVAVSDNAGATCNVTLVAGKGSCQVNPLVAGTRNFTATYAGDGNFNGSSGVASQTVNKAGTSLTVSASPNPSVVGQAVIVGVTVNAAFGGTPTGSVAISDSTGASCTATLSGGAGQCSLLPGKPGADTISASYAGDSNFIGSSNQLSEQVNKANTTTSVTSSPNPSLLNQTITVNFTVSANPPATGTPTGTVNVTDSTGVSCSATLSSGKGSCTITPKSVGNDAITATYGGDANFNGSSGTVSQQPVQYKFTGFLTPLGPAGTYSGGFNFGKVVPVKWQLTDFNGNLISSTKSLSVMVAYFTGAPPASGVCPIATSSNSILLYSPTAGAAGNSTFRYSSGQFIFNWDTSSADPYGRGCFTLSVQLNDGSTPKLTSLQLQ